MATRPAAALGEEEATTAQTQSATSGLFPDTVKAPVIAVGRVRKGRRTKALIKRLKPGDIAVIDHTDIDAMAAQGLVECRPSAVIDAALPISGRYPNRGPSIIVAAKIPLFALLNPEVFDLLTDGAPLTIRADGTLHQNGVTFKAAAKHWDERRVRTETLLARRNLTSEIQRFADNTLSFVRTEAETLLEPASLPELVGVPKIEKRHVVVVVRGEGYKEDLASIRGYLDDVRPIIIGVDGGADALLDAGIRPTIILGDMDSVSDRALKCGAKLVVQAYAATGDAPGLERVQQLGLKAEVFRVPGTSEDAALLLAHERGAALIVAVGTHSGLEDFLDKGRAGMASTFLTRLKVGSRLVDARGVSKLYQSRPGFTEFAALALCAAFVVVTVLSQTEFGQLTMRLIHLWWRLTLVNLQHLAWHPHSH